MSTQSAANISMPAIPAHPTRAMLSLTSKVPLRLPVLRNGRNLNTARPSNLEALYGQYVGQVNVPGCTHCAGGFGMWTECVSVSGHFGGSCANCHYGSEGARCYLRLASPVGAAASSAPAALPANRSLLQVAPDHQVVRRSLTHATRVHAIARLHKELAELYAEEAEELEEKEREILGLEEKESDGGKEIARDEDDELSR